MCISDGNADEFSSDLPELALPEITGLDVDLDGFLIAVDQPNGGERTSETVAKEWLVSVRPMPGALTNGSEPLLLLRELVDLGARCVHVDVDEIPDFDAFNPASAYLEWQYRLPVSVPRSDIADIRSEEHTSELQSLMRISYAVFCLKKKN